MRNKFADHAQPATLAAFVSLAASIAFVFLVFIGAILAMAIWGRVIELPEFHRSM